ncbi:MAG: Yip1 family protein [Chloroflexota bacterium]|nr:YIP1 family protein [Chloroflexota bacterium]
MKIYEEFRLAASGTRLYCPDCGQSNSSGRETCEACNTTLLRSASIFQNLLDAIVRPMQGMKRVAATAPLIQGLLLVLLTTAFQFVLYAISGYHFWQYYFTNPDKIASDFPNIYNDPNYINLFLEDKVTSGLPEFWQLLLLYGLSWFLFTGAIYLGVRLFYQKEAHFNYLNLLSVVAFSRVSYLGLLVLAVVVLLAPETTSVVRFFNLLPLVWQAFLLIVGVRTSTGLNWNRAGIVVMIPVLMFTFLVGLPF